MKTRLHTCALLISIVGTVTACPPENNANGTTNGGDAGTADAGAGDSGAPPDAGGGEEDMGPTTPLSAACALGDGFRESADVFSISIGNIALDGDLLYVVDSDFNVRRYTIGGTDDCTLSLDATYGASGVVDLPEDVSDVELTEAGDIVVATRSRIVRLDADGAESAACDVADTSGQIEWGRGFGIVDVTGSTDIFVIDRTIAESFKVDLDAANCEPEAWLPQGFLDMPNNGLEGLHAYDDTVVAWWWDNESGSNELLFLDEVGNTKSTSWSAGVRDLFTPDYKLYGVEACSSEAGNICVADNNTLWILDSAGEVIIERSINYVVTPSMTRDFFDIVGDGRFLFASVNEMQDSDSMGNVGRIYRIDADAVLDDLYEQ